MKNVLILIAMTLCFGLSGCTDGTLGKLSAYGGTGSIECYSGGVSIYKGNSTGKIKSEENSDGYYFIDTHTGKLTEVSGECVITYNSY